MVLVLLSWWMTRVMLVLTEDERIPPNNPMGRVLLSPWERLREGPTERKRPPGSERRLLLSQCVCAPVPVRVPVSPVAPRLGWPFLPPAAPRPPALGFL